VSDDAHPETHFSGRSVRSWVLNLFENLVQPTAPPPEDAPPATLVGFFLYHLRPVRGLVLAMFVGGFLEACLDASVPIFIGRIAGIAATVKPHALLHDAGMPLAAMAVVILVVRPVIVLAAGKTTIAIAHRLSTIARMDRLIVLEAGRIVEQGTHAELPTGGGVYAQLWQRQSGGFHSALALL
jgi:ABC-type multidrug transport system fused ATPase/permease subunit